MSRFKVINKSLSAHCCFKATVIDTQKQGAIDRQTVCECFDEAEAEKICLALNEKQMRDTW